MHSAARTAKESFDAARPSGLARSLSAMLRHRARDLRGTLPARLTQALRFLPVVLTGSFPHPIFKSDAPGVEGVVFRRGWGPLSNSFGLPPPNRLPRGRALIEAVLVVPGRSSALALLLHRAQTHAEREVLDKRVAHTQTLFASLGVRLELLALDADDQAAAGVTLRRAVAFGGLLAGALPPSMIAAADAPEPHASELAAEAPGALAAIALLLLGDQPAPSPVQAVAEALRRGHTARSLACPARFAVEWTARSTGAGPLLRAALRLIEEGEGRPGAPPARSRAPGEPEQMDLQSALMLSSRLAVALLRAARRSKRLWSDPLLRAQVLGDLISGGVPRALRPALARRLPAGPEKILRVGNRCQVVAGGVVVASGGSEEQARVRFLALIGQIAPANGQRPVAFDPPWDAIAARLARSDESAGVFLSVAPSIAPGPPFDPLNRGPLRELGFADGLLVRFSPGRRPSARKLTARQTIDQLMESAFQNEQVEISGQGAEAQPAAARLLRLAAFVRQSRGARTTCVLEAGGLVYELREGKIRRYQLATYLRRPRLFQCDPESPDLSVTPERGLATRADLRQVVQCRIELRNQSAGFLWVDARGGRMNEEVPPDAATAHLEEAQALLRALSPGFVTTVRASSEVEKAVLGTARLAPIAEVTVGGLLPGPLILEVNGQRFHTLASGCWDAAATLISSIWPVGQRGRIIVRFAPGSVAPAAGPGELALLALYTRSAVLRRLGARLTRILG